MIDTMPKTHTLDIEGDDGVVRQYGFHLGTIRPDALTHGWDVARAKLERGAKTVALKFDGEVVKIWDWRDLDRDQAERSLTRIKNICASLGTDGEHILQELDVIEKVVRNAD